MVNSDMDSRATYMLTSGPQGPISTVNGKRVINLASNNYLCLNAHPKVKEAAARAIEAYGVGACASRAVIGTMSIHAELERLLAEFHRTQIAVAFGSGFTANLGILGSVLSEGDVAIGDELNHESIVDGVRLAKAAYETYGHLDMGELEKALAKATSKGHRTVLVVTDGVFSMSGDVAPLPMIADLAAAYGALTMVDDAHSVGVLGDNGRGTVNHFHLEDRWDIYMAGMSKAFGVGGGYVACQRSLGQRIMANAHTFMYTTADPPPVVAACIASLQLLLGDEGNGLIRRMWENARFFKKGLEELGFLTGASQTPITPIVVGDQLTARRFSQRLFEEGVLALDFSYPVVPQGQSLLRTIVTAGHTRGDLERALEAVAKVGKELRLAKGT